MRKLIFLSVITMAIPIMSIAQDDMYFVPKKAEKVLKSTYEYSTSQDTYHSGSDRSIDEYNRRGTYVTEIDSTGNDIIDFDGIAGVYPDSSQVYEEDYTYTRRMSRFDDYAWVDPYWAGYYAGRTAGWGWYDPWLYGGYYYSGWYYDPWYYSWHHPWYYGWYGHGWGYPHYVVSYNPRPVRTFNHIVGTGRRPLAGYGSTSSGFGGVTNSNRLKSGNLRNKTFNASERFGTNRNTNANKTNTVRNNTNNMSTTRPSSSFGSGSGFGGSRSGGGFSGGSRSVGGGSRFGGRR